MIKYGDAHKHHAHDTHAHAHLRIATLLFQERERKQERKRRTRTNLANLLPPPYRDTFSPLQFILHCLILHSSLFFLFLFVAVFSRYCNFSFFFVRFFLSFFYLLSYCCWQTSWKSAETHTYMYIQRERDAKIGSFV